MRKILFWLLPALALPAFGAELSFDLGDFATNAPPAGFSSLLYGHGRPGDWQVIMDAVPPVIAPATDKAPVVTKRAVVTQLKKDPTDERFPLLVYDGLDFRNFTLTTRLKISGGLMEQVAGIAFRIQNETNFYVIRANAIDHNLKFYKVVNGFRSPMLGPALPVALNEWHTLKIKCEGNQISAWFDDREAIKLITDTSFTSGKIGYWTKSDSVCSFTDTRITYQPREALAVVVTRDLLAKYSRLHDLKVYLADEKGEPRVVAARNPADIGQAGDKPQKDAIARNAVFVAKTKTDINVVLALRDYNGESMGAMTVSLDSFPGQTEENAIYRAKIIAREFEQRARSIAELRE